MFIFFFFTDTSPTEIYTLSLHDALPIWTYDLAHECGHLVLHRGIATGSIETEKVADRLDRKSTRLNSSHVAISYAVFCLKKKINTSLGTRSLQFPSSQCTTLISR